MLWNKTLFKCVEKPETYELISKELTEAIDKKEKDEKVNEILKRYNLPLVEDIRDNNLYLVITSYNWSEIDIHGDNLNDPKSFILSLRKWKRMNQK